MAAFTCHSRIMRTYVGPPRDRTAKERGEVARAWPPAFDFAIGVDSQTASHFSPRCVVRRSFPAYHEIPPLWRTVSRVSSENGTWHQLRGQVRIFKNDPVSIRWKVR